jgi:hypothetical protein
MSEEQQERERQEAANRMARQRDEMSREQQERKRQEAVRRMARRRDEMSEEQQERERQEAANSMVRRRDEMSEEQQERERQEAANRMARRRDEMSEEEQERERQEAAHRMARRRDEMLEDERFQHQQIHAQQVREDHRQRRSHRNERRIAVDNSVAILSGQIDVIPCSIGPRTVCIHCNAKLWTHETRWSAICCAKGKITVDKWRRRDINSNDEEERYAARIHALWQQNDADSRLLREFARPLNNALALASQVVNEKIRSHDEHFWMPNVVIRGKLFHKIGYSLLPPEGTVPRFAQIYVYDPEQDEGAEANIRLGHMRLRSGTTEATRDRLLVLLSKLQRWLQRCNPYI